jgi:hypothetical protein
MRQILGKLSYANVMATLAVFVALGGASYAAIKLPKDSVGSAQIKPNAVNGSKIANGSLTAKDFAGGPGQVADGAPGPPGTPGAPGLDGAAITVRARSTSGVETPADHSFVTVPLTGGTWTQGAADLDIGPFGSLTVTAPGPSTCGSSGLANLDWTIEIDGKVFAAGTTQIPRDGASHTFHINLSNFLIEPGSDTQQTATAKVSSVCESGNFPIPIAVSDFRFDLIRAS